MKTPSEQEIEAYLAGKPVPPEFLAELESRTSNLLTQLNEMWNPKQNCPECGGTGIRLNPNVYLPSGEEAPLTAPCECTSQQASTDSLSTSGAGSLPTTEQPER